MLNEIRLKYLKTSQKGLKVEKAEQIADRHNGKKKISDIR